MQLARVVVYVRVLVDVIGVMVVVLIGHDEVRAVGAVLVAIFAVISVTGDVLFTPPVGDSDLR